MDFNAYWDKRIEANKRLFDNNHGIANFLFDECQLLYEHMTKENNELKRLLAMQSDLDLQGYEHMRDELQALREQLAESEQRVKALEELVSAAVLAIGEHNAPADCYATGPLTGNPIADLCICPACSFLSMHKALEATCQNTPRG